MSHSQNSFLKTLDKHRLENSEGEGELLSYAGDAESYLPVDGAKDTAQPLRSTSGTAACRGRGQPGSNMGRGCMGFSTVCTWPWCSLASQFSPAQHLGAKGRDVPYLSCVHASMLYGCRPSAPER